MQVQDWAQGGAYVEADAPISAPACVITVEAEEEETPIVDDEEDSIVDEDEEAMEDEEAPAVEEEEDGEKAPATGDASQMAMYLMVMIGAAGAAYVLKKQK